MAVSRNPRARDLAAVYRLVGECRELGADARVWQRHLVGEVRRMFGCYMGGAGETMPTPLGMQNDWATYMAMGWTEHEKTVAHQLLTGHFPPDQFCLRLSQEFVRDRPLQLTRQRQELIADSEWFRSDTFETYRVTGSSDIVMSLLQLPGSERALCVGFTRGVGERALNSRETQVISLLCRLIRPHLGRGLAMIGEPGIAELSPRRRQVLAGLLDGLSEKEVAQQLNLSPPTVHEYVMALYRHFRVSSRGELLAAFLRRHQGPASQWIQSFGPGDPPYPPG